MHSEITLDQHTDRVAPILWLQLSRGGAGSAFPFEADHSGAAADISFGDRAAVSVGHSGLGVFGLYVEAIDVVQIAIPGFGDDRERPPIFERQRGAVLQLPGDNRVAHDPHAVGVGDHHRTVKKAGFIDPGGASHFAIAVFGEPAGKNRIDGRLASRKNGGDAGAHGAFAHFQFSFAGNQGAVADFDAFHVGDGIERAGRAFEGHAQVAGARSRLSGGRGGHQEQCSQQNQSFHFHQWPIARNLIPD